MDILEELVDSSPMPLPAFHAAVSDWFDAEFERPTKVQLAAWEAIRARRNTLISAPTGAGKTLAAFLSVIDELVLQALDGGLEERTQILYVSPLKALSNDVQKNLERPLEGIRRALAARLLDDAPIRAMVRTGDTPQSERARMRRQPPHILVTTPESLFILLTSDSGREMLSTVGTVIVDEIHAVAGNKRGAHLALSLARLDALTGTPATRVGISATSKPIDEIAAFLTGSREHPCEIIDAGHQRERDVELLLPSAPLEAIMPNEVWIEIYDRLAGLIDEHRTTLVFVNTRRMAERVARNLAERVGDDLVTSHHGSLAKEHRLKAEQSLKAGKLRAIVATASLELGIDIGDVDLVCQLGSPRAITAFLQRVGRSGHGIGRVPKGRLLPLTRDELVESAALIDCVRRGELDTLEIVDGALDVLAQQIVAEVGMREWALEDLLALCRRAFCYRSLSPETFEAVIGMLADGFTTHRGRRSAHIHYDRVNKVLRGRKGARLTAITNGGAIPDQFDYDVVLLPQDHPVGSVNEDFATESMPGDIFQLGNTSYRILKVSSGKVYVEDAKGQPPNIPFWFGEAPGRSDELSTAVSRLREHIDTALSDRSVEAVTELLVEELGIEPAAAQQITEYLAAARAALGGLPTQSAVYLERFFDEAGDTHLVVHSPFGSRLNRAWGLALRKSFCRRFNFELQAAALEDSIILSLGAVHSFELGEVSRYLSSKSIHRVTEQAVLGAPLFETHWRFNATIGLAVRRFQNGRKKPAQLQRMDAEDLLATVFPEQLACAENLPGGDLPVPDHPLVTQALSDCLHRIMDVDALAHLLESIEGGRVEVRTAELTSPSPLAQEILGARPYAFLDDAPAEERRTLAVQSRRYMDVEQAAELGRLDQAAIERVRDEAWPRAGNADELHDALVLLGFITEDEGRSARGQDLSPLFAELVKAGRATRYVLPDGTPLWVSTERLPECRLARPDGQAVPEVVELPTPVTDRETACRELLRGRLEGLGPVTASALGSPLGLDEADIAFALTGLEQQGIAMQGNYTGSRAGIEWCERRLLARIHRYTLKRLRSEIAPVGPADFQRFLFGWQGLGSEQREGREALFAVIRELQGLSLPAVVWERDILPARIRDFTPLSMDDLSREGSIVWWRPRKQVQGRATSTVAASPICILPREKLRIWQALADATIERAALSVAATKVHDLLEASGAQFFVDIVAATGLLRVQVEDALSELVAQGLVSSDAFVGLRAVLSPQRDRGSFRGRRATRAASAFDRAGRWALLRPIAGDELPELRAEAVELAARCLLRRYGVVTRVLAQREALAPPWRELVALYRRWEASGEIRGGRFIEPYGGEQFALNEAVEALRRTRREADSEQWIRISAADPLNLAGIDGGQKRVPAIGANRIVYANGVQVVAAVGNRVDALQTIDAEGMARATALLHVAKTTRRSRWH